MAQNMERKKRSPAVDLRSAPPSLCPESSQVHQLASKHPILIEWTDQKTYSATAPPFFSCQTQLGSVLWRAS